MILEASSISLLQSGILCVLALGYWYYATRAEERVQASHKTFLLLIAIAHIIKAAGCAIGAVLESQQPPGLEQQGADEHQTRWTQTFAVINMFINATSTLWLIRVWMLPSIHQRQIVQAAAVAAPFAAMVTAWYAVAVWSEPRAVASGPALEAAIMAHSVLAALAAAAVVLLYARRPASGHFLGYLCLAHVLVAVSLALALQAGAGDMSSTAPPESSISLLALILVATVRVVVLPAALIVAVLRDARWWSADWKRAPAVMGLRVGCGYHDVKSANSIPARLVVQELAWSDLNLWGVTRTHARSLSMPMELTSPVAGSGRSCRALASKLEQCRRQAVRVVCWNCYSTTSVEARALAASVDLQERGKQVLGAGAQLVGNVCTAASSLAAEDAAGRQRLLAACTGIFARISDASQVQATFLLGAPAGNLSAEPAATAHTPLLGLAPGLGRASDLVVQDVALPHIAGARSDLWQRRARLLAGTASEAELRAMAEFEVRRCDASFSRWIQCAALARAANESMVYQINSLLSRCKLAKLSAADVQLDHVLYHQGTSTVFVGSARVARRPTPAAIKVVRVELVVPEDEPSLTTHTLQALERELSTISKLPSRSEFVGVLGVVHAPPDIGIVFELAQRGDLYCALAWLRHNLGTPSMELAAPRGQAVPLIAGGLAGLHQGFPLARLSAEQLQAVVAEHYDALLQQEDMGGVEIEYDAMALPAYVTELETGAQQCASTWLQLSDATAPTATPVHMQCEVRGAAELSAEAVAARMDWRVRLGMALSVARGLDVLHRMNHLHRDVKPHNVFVMADFSVKLADFGAGRELSDSMTSNLGTSGHMAPEVQTQGSVDMAAYNAKCDVFSWGMLAWQILTMGDLFDNEDARAMNLHIRQGQRPAFPPYTPSRFRALVESAWAQNPDHRCSMAEIVQQLESMVFILDQQLLAARSWLPGSP